MQPLLTFFSSSFQCLGRTQEQRIFEERLYHEGLQKEQILIINKINQTILSQDLARKFILQELDILHQANILHQGDSISQDFLETSGFHLAEYLGSSKNPETNPKDIESIQLVLIDFLEKISNEKLMTKLSMSILNGVMEHWEIGKYSEEGQFFIKEYQNKEKPPLEKKSTPFSLILYLKGLQPIIMAKLVYADEQIQKLLDTYMPKKTKKETTEQTVQETQEAQETVKIYNDEKVYELMEEYSHIMEELITGKIHPENYEEIKRFQEQISLASIEGNNLASVFSPFFQSHPSFPTLPLPISHMDEKSKKFFIEILNSFQKKGFSENLKVYLYENHDNVYSLAIKNDMFMQYLIGFWYERETNAKFWYEQAASNGLEDAIERLKQES